MTEEMVEEKEPQEVDELAAALEGNSKEDQEEDQDKETGEKGEKDEKGDNRETGETGEEDGEKEEGKDEGKDESDPVKALQGEVKDLRQMVRTSKRELSITQAKLKRLGEKKPEARDEDEDEDEDVKRKEKREESLSTIEELQKSISSVGASKGAALDVLLEAMEQNTKYEDIREVCSRENFDDIFEVIATEATKDGGNFDETLLEVELNVWNKTNPYRYMYELIKKYHPNYKAKEGVAEPGDKKKGKAPVKAKAPGTIADKGGDSNVKGGWTAKRIDDLPEDELHTVPREIYERYMKDDLD